MQVRHAPFLGFGVGFFQVVHPAGFDGDETGAATAGATARINLNALGPGKFQKIFRRGFPADRFVGTRET